MSTRKQDWCFNIKFMSRILTLTALFMNGMATRSQAMEWVAGFGTFVSAASSLLSGPTQKVVDAAAGFLEIEKTQDNLFNEAIANSKREEAEKVVQKVFSDIRDEFITLEIKTNRQIQEQYERNTIVKRIFDAHQRWYIKCRMAFLILDYVDAFLEECDEAKKRIEGLIPKVNPLFGFDAEKVKSQELHYSEFVKEIEAKRLNIGANLSATYKYVRGGGVRDRFIKTNQTQHERFKKWGVYKFPEVSSSLTEKTWVESQSSSKREEDERIQKIRFSYLATVKVLADHGIVANSSIEESILLINKHIQAFYKTFPDVKLSQLKLKPRVFPEHRERSRSKLIVSSSPSTAPHSPSTAPHSPIISSSKSMSIQPSKVSMKSEPIPIPVNPHKQSSADLLGMSPLKSSSVPQQDLFKDLLALDDHGTIHTPSSGLIQISASLEEHDPSSDLINFDNFTEDLEDGEHKDTDIDKDNDGSDEESDHGSDEGD